MPGTATKPSSRRRLLQDSGRCPRLFSPFSVFVVLFFVVSLLVIFLLSVDWHFVRNSESWVFINPPKVQSVS
jgi:hypothetical protein